MKPVATFGGLRSTPEGTREFWGYLAEGAETPADGTPLVALPPVVPVEDQRNADCCLSDALDYLDDKQPGKAIAAIREARAMLALSDDKAG